MAHDKLKLRAERLYLIIAQRGNLILDKSTDWSKVDLIGEVAEGILKLVQSTKLKGVHFDYFDELAIISQVKPRKENLSCVFC